MRKSISSPFAALVTSVISVLATGSLRTFLHLTSMCEPMGKWPEQREPRCQLGNYLRHQESDYPILTANAGGIAALALCRSPRSWQTRSQLG